MGLSLPFPYISDHHFVLSGNPIQSQLPSSLRSLLFTTIFRKLIIHLTLLNMGNAATVIPALHRIHNENRSISDEPSLHIFETLEEASKRLMQNTELRMTFVNYFFAGNWVNSFLTNNSNFQALDITVSDLLDDMSLLANNTKDEMKSSPLLTSTRTTSSEDTSEHVSILASDPTSLLSRFLTDPQKVLPILIACAYPRFLTSEEYQGWLAQLQDIPVVGGHPHFHSFDMGNDDHTDSTTDENQWTLSKQATGALQRTVTYGGNRSHRQNRESRAQLPYEIRLADKIQNCLAHLRPGHVSNILNFPTTGYVGHLHKMLDHAPIAISIARVKSNFFQHLDFSKTGQSDRGNCRLPIVYANQACESVLERKRKDLLHCPAHHLWDEQTFEQTANLARFHRALELMRPLEMVMRRSNSTADQSHNVLVTVKPVFNSDLGVYTHVIILLYELPKKAPGGSSDATVLAHDLPMIEDLLNLLPNILS